MQPIILLSGSIIFEQKKQTYQVAKDYATAILKAGGIPLLHLGGIKEGVVNAAAALLLCGGGDIDPASYGETPLNNTVQVDKERDKIEKELYTAFKAQKKPILGICRGIQCMNVWEGGTLWQDLQAEGQKSHSGGITHKVTIKQKSNLLKNLPTTFTVNSWHHQAIKKPAPTLQALAISEDGIVEAVAHETQPIYGIQWHPERHTEGTENCDSLFARFLHQVKNNCL